MEDPGRSTGNIRDVHGNVFPLLDVAEGNLRTDQRLLERETAPEKKGDEIFSPVPVDLPCGGFQFSIAVDVVARDIRPDVRIIRQKFRPEFPGIENLEKGQGFGFL